MSGDALHVNGQRIGLGEVTLSAGDELALQAADGEYRCVQASRCPVRQLHVTSPLSAAPTLLCARRWAVEEIPREVAVAIRMRVSEEEFCVAQAQQALSLASSRVRLGAPLRRACDAARAHSLACRMPRR